MSHRYIPVPDERLLHQTSRVPMMVTRRHYLAGSGSIILRKRESLYGSLHVARSYKCDDFNTTLDPHHYDNTDVRDLTSTEY